MNVFFIHFLYPIMQHSVSPDLAAMLESEAARINSPAFIADDPVRFPRQFSRLQDIEIAALLSSSVAWGNRTMICRDCEKMFSLMGWDPYNYVMSGDYEDLPDMNIHRTFFARNLRHFLRGLHRIYSCYDSIDSFASTMVTHSTEAAPWVLAEAINGQLALANDGKEDSRCLPLNMKQTALKRFNMALRWLVRDDGIVDMGVWKSLTPAQLYIPLDVHVGNTARNLGLIDRKANDRCTAEMLTDVLRPLRPSDPAFFDYALFGIGIEGKRGAGCADLS